jgi:hypothetical protein
MIKFPAKIGRPFVARRITRKIYLKFLASFLVRAALRVVLLPARSFQPAALCDSAFVKKLPPPTNTAPSNAADRNDGQQAKKAGPAG